MNCPKCKAKTGVRNSRPYRNRRVGEFVYRERVCPSCGEKFETVEIKTAVLDRYLPEGYGLKYPIRKGKENGKM